MTLPAPLRIAFDIGGVLSRHPELIQLFVSLECRSIAFERYAITDMTREAAEDMLASNGLETPASHLICCDHQRYGDECKAVACREHGIDILIDDHLGYVSVPGAPPVRLLVMPEPARDYYHPEWKTDGSEGAFGRRLAAAIAEEGLMTGAQIVAPQRSDLPPAIAEAEWEVRRLTQALQEAKISLTERLNEWAQTQDMPAPGERISIERRGRGEETWEVIRIIGDIHWDEVRPVACCALVKKNGERGERTANFVREPGGEWLRTWYGGG